jgi:hypothetical protein
MSRSHIVKQGVNDQKIFTLEHKCLIFKVVIGILFVKFF